MKNHTMKIKKLISPTAAIFLFMTLLLPAATNAATDSYTFNANWTETTCTGTINGSTGIINYHITQGDTLNITLVNQSSSAFNVTYAKSGGTGSFFKFVVAGASDSESFANVQGNISVTPSANGSGCGTAGYQYSGPGPASASITADPPAAPPATPAATSPKSTPTAPPTSSTTASQSSTATPTASTDPVQITTVYVAGKPISTTNAINLGQSQALKLTGHTTANGIVTLTIHSVPKTVTVNADENGNWSYIVTNLAAGSHYIEASVTDPATKAVSAATKLLTFTVNKQPVAVAKIKPTSNKSKFIIGGAIVGAAIIAALAYMLLKNKRRAQLPEPEAGPSQVAYPVFPTTTVGTTQLPGVDTSEPEKDIKAHEL